MDWVGAHLLGYNAAKVALVREAFGDFRWPLSRSGPDELTLVGDWPAGDTRGVLRQLATNADVAHPIGWRGAAATAAPISASAP
jgi:hypothetical protein